MRAVEASQVLRHIPEVADVIVPFGNGEPATVLDVIEAHASRFEHVRLHQMHALRDRPYLHGFVPQLRHVAYFLGPVTRPAFQSGTVDLVPNDFSDVPFLMEATQPDLVVAAAAPMDDDGYFSLGTGADYTAHFIGRVPFFIEANRQVPRTRGAHRIHVSQVVGWCEADYPLVAVPPPQPGAKDEAFARSVASRIPDGAVIQAGIGTVPSAVLGFLEDRRGLRIFTELLGDGFMELMQAGATTGEAVTTIALGSQGLYDWLDGNEEVVFRPVEEVNDPFTIGSFDNVVSINATTEVDFLGQCASETVAGRYYSSSGGQADFARGVRRSRGGRGFVVLHSTTKDGQHSKISPVLPSGSAVTTGKNTVDMVVTEFGVAELKGKPIRERTEALIQIAHPKFRHWLRREAHRLGYLPGRLIGARLA